MYSSFKSDSVKSPFGQTDDDMFRLRNLRTKNPNKIIIAHLNINSRRNKFEALSLSFYGVINILMTCETKIDDSSPVKEFIIEVYLLTIYRLGRNDRGGGIMLIVKDNLVTSRIDKYCFPDEIEIFCIELNLQKEKWLIICWYNPDKHLVKHHLFEAKSVINFYSKTK